MICNAFVKKKMDVIYMPTFPNIYVCFVCLFVCLFVLFCFVLLVCLFVFSTFPDICPLIYNNCTGKP